MKYLKTYKIFENISIDEYLKQAYLKDYEEITPELYSSIEEEGFVEALEDYYETEYEMEDFEYIILDLDDEDKNGLISMNDETLTKFNDFDIMLKKEQEPDYPTMVDFIDYDKGIVYIIRLI